MLEIGLALIAACLPTLTTLLNRRTLQSATRSFRKIFMLRSDDSTQAWSSLPPHEDRNGTFSKSSLNNYFSANQASADSISREISNIDKGIYVSHEVELSSFKE